MKVFWIIGFVPTELSQEFHTEAIMSGGWVRGMRDRIAGQEDIALTIVFKTSENEIKSGFVEEERYSYIGVPSNTYSTEMVTILCKDKPDVIHMWGTEYLIALETLMAAETAGMAKKTVLWLQGLVSEIWQYMTVGLPPKVQTGATLYERLRHCSISTTQKSFRERGEREKACLKKSAVILGRTAWDRACVAQYGCENKYRVCNDNLRPSFYQNKWILEKCEKHSVFVSRGDTPIKGLHRMLPALAILKERYPDVKLYVAGEDPTYRDDLKRRLLKKRKYTDYICRQIKELGLEDRVVFLGSLSEEEMLRAYQRAQVFALTSTIENSPNSLGEAMLLGMPCVAADVGGVTSLMTSEKEGFVCQGDSPAMLAYRIASFFEDSNLAVHMGEAARERARITHDPNKNATALMDIYTSLLK